MHDSLLPYSNRHGYRGHEAEITVREILRERIVMLGYGSGSLRSDICEVLPKLPFLADTTGDEMWYFFQPVADQVFSTDMDISPSCRPRPNRSRAERNGRRKRNS